MIWPHVTQGYLSALEHGQMAPGARMLLERSPKHSENQFSPRHRETSCGRAVRHRLQAEFHMLGQFCGFVAAPKGESYGGKNSEKHHISAASELLSDGGFIEISRI
jgi:hypothetical protein